jgi:hypothetical protein
VTGWAGWRDAIREAVLEATSRASRSAQEAHGVVSEHAIGAAAVGDDLDVVGQVAQFTGEALGRSRAGSGDVPGCVLRWRTYIDHDDVAGGDPGGQLDAAHLVQLIAVAEVGGGELGRVRHDALRRRHGARSTGR